MCCVTRAIHLELVEDLSAETFRKAFRRFTAGRGTPTLIVSDNAKTFQATEKALNKLFESSVVRDDLDNLRIEWKINLEQAPWWDGFFEETGKQCKELFRESARERKTNVRRDAHSASRNIPEIQLLLLRV